MCIQIFFSTCPIIRYYSVQTSRHIISYSHTKNIITRRCRAKPNVTTLTHRLRYKPPAFSDTHALALLLLDKAVKNWLPWQRPLTNRKTNFRLIIYSRSSNNPENLAKIRSGRF